ncbi:MAG: DUF3352 domain-containing protein [Gaiellaceae bacterium]
MRFIPVLLVAALLPVLAGCGSGSDVGGAADVVPADVFLYASVDTDFDGDGWAALEEFAARFPNGDNLLQSLADEVNSSEEGIDFETDVKPALGPEVAFVMLDAPATPDLGEAPPGMEAYGDAPQFVVLLQPDDAAAFQRLLDKSDEPPVTDEVDGWTVVAENQESLDSFRARLDGPTLDGSEDFEQAMDGLDDGALARVFVNGEKLSEAYEADPAAAPPVDALLPGGELPSFGMTFDVEADSARIDGRAVFAGENPFATDSYSADLPEKVPGDVLAYVSFNDLESAFSAFRDAAAESDPEAESQLGMAEAFLGVSLEEDVLPLLSGEGAVYVRQGAIIPEVTLVTEIEDEDEAMTTLDEIVQAASGFAPDLGSPKTVEIGGVEARELPVSPPMSLYYAAFDGLLVVTSSPEGIAALREEGDRLSDSEAFDDALDAAGVPDETRGFGYVDLERAVPLFLGFAEAGDAATGEARGYLDPLQSLVFYSDQDDETASFTFFVGVE